VVVVVVEVVVVVNTDGRYTEISCKLHNCIRSIWKESELRRLIIL
jgi:hypothetical protein